MAFGTLFLPPVAPSDITKLRFTNIVDALLEALEHSDLSASKHLASVDREQLYRQKLTDFVEELHKRSCDFSRAEYAASEDSLFVKIDDSIHVLPLIHIIRKIAEGGQSSDEAFILIRHNLLFAIDGKPVSDVPKRLQLAKCLHDLFWKITGIVPVSTYIQNADAFFKRPSKSSLIAEQIADYFVKTHKAVTDMRNDIIYLRTNDGWIWGTNAESYIKKKVFDLSEKLFEELYLRYCLERSNEGKECESFTLQEFRANLSSSTVEEAIKRVRMRTYYDKVDVLLSWGNRFIQYKGGYLNVDSWFSSGVLTKHPEVDAIVIHKLPQEEFELDALNGRFEDLYDIERIAEQFTPTLLDAMRQWVPDPDQRLNLWLAMGYSVYPAMPYKKFFVIVGPPNSGKSTLLKFIGEALGNENTSSVTLGHLLGSRSEYYAMELYHKLANLADEGVASTLLRKPDKSFELLKALVGGASVTARAPYGKPFKFQNYAKLFFITNDRNVVDMLSSDPAVAGRLVVIEFQREFSENFAFRRNLLREAPKALPVLLVALRVLRKNKFAKLGGKVELSGVVWLCERYGVKKKRSDECFLPAEVIRRELGVAAKELAKLLRKYGIEASYGIYSGKRGVSVPNNLKLVLSDELSTGTTPEK